MQPCVLDLAVLLAYMAGIVLLGIHMFGIGVPSALFARAAGPPAPRAEPALAA